MSLNAINLKVFITNDPVAAFFHFKTLKPKNINIEHYFANFIQKNIMLENSFKILYDIAFKNNIITKTKFVELHNFLVFSHKNVSFCEKIFPFFKSLKKPKYLLDDNQILVLRFFLEEMFNLSIEEM